MQEQETEPNSPFALHGVAQIPVVEVTPQQALEALWLKDPLGYGDQDTDVAIIYQRKQYALIQSGELKKGQKKVKPKKEKPNVEQDED